MGTDDTMSASENNSPVAQPEKGAPDIPADANLFMRIFGLTQLAFIICYFLFVDYNGAGDLVIGSGFLMTFLAKYAHSSLGYTFMMTAVTIQYSLLAQGFFHHLHAGDLFDGDITRCVET